MRYGIAEILSLASKLKKPEERIATLQANDSFALRHILRGMFDPGVVWAIDPEDIEFSVAKVQDTDVAMLYTEAKRLYLFTSDGNPNLDPTKRKILFIQLLESLPESDANLLVSMIRKQSPFKNITAELVQKAFPGLF